MKMVKGFVEEFKVFISRGNVMDMAVGVIIGGAFQKIITSMVEDMVMPLISVVTGGIDFTDWQLVLGANENSPVLHYGNLLTAVINFLLMALVIFMVIKSMNSFSAKVKHKPEVATVPTTKKCPYCLSEIPIEATRCAHCTSQLEEEKTK